MPQVVQTAAQVLPADTAPPEAPPADWRHSLTKAVTYQTIVVTTDQLLSWVIVTGTTATELEFFAANAVTGVGYYVAFDQVWAAAVLIRRRREPGQRQQGSRLPCV